MRTFTPHELWYGRDEPPITTQLLRAGPLTAILDGCDLRCVKIGGVEIVRRLYAAVRDHNWNTIPGTISDLKCDAASDHFTISFQVRHHQQHIDFSWRGEIRGDSHGKITYAFDGEAGSDFRYNRIGFCLLHPPKYAAGRPYRGITPDGPIDGVLPLTIEPQRIVEGVYFAMFPAVSSLSIDLPAGDYGADAAVRFDFEGDLFEMEDQRNWTDASYKTYCTPLAEPWPKDARVGQHIQQKVTVSLENVGRIGANAAKKVGGESVAVPIALTLGEALDCGLPAIGLGMASHGAALTEQEIARLRALHLDHLRADVHFGSRDYKDAVDAALHACAALGCGIELALFVTNNAEIELGRLAKQLELALPRLKVPISRILVFHEKEQATGGRWVEVARERLRTVAANVPFAGGTNANFCELNRNRPQIRSMNAVVYPITPQVHAFDETSLIETLEAQPDTVDSARAFCGNKPLIVSPVTLKQRFNPAATGLDADPDPNQLPTQVDPRQMSLFGAAWTLGSIKSLAEAGAESVTYYETTGWRGVIETESGSPGPGRFPSESGMVFPLYHVFADVGEWKSGEIVDCLSDDPLVVQGLALFVDDSLHIALANMTSAPQRVVIRSFTSRTAAIRRLDEFTSQAALFDPEGFRSRSETMAIPGGELTLGLAAYEVVRVDLPPTE